MTQPATPKFQRNRPYVHPVARVTASTGGGCTEVLNKLESIFEQQLGPDWEWTTLVGDYPLLTPAVRNVLLAELEAAGKLVVPFDYADLYQRVKRLLPKLTAEELQCRRASIKELEDSEDKSDLY